jgi:trigger factor
MAIKTRIENEIKLVVDYTTEEKEYGIWREKIRKQLLKNVEVPGFRKGKAPEHLAVQNINPQAFEETILQEAIEKYGREAVTQATKQMEEQKKVVIPGSFIVDPSSLNHEKGLSFSINAEILPDIKLDPSKIKVKQPTEKDLNDRIELKEFIATQKSGFLASHAKYTESEEKIAHLYKFTADSTGKVDGKDAPQLDTKDMSGVVGIAQFLPDFEKGVLGMKKDEIKSFDVNFPSNYHSQELAGKKAIFTVTMTSVEKPESLDFDIVMQNDDHSGHNHEQFKDEKAFDDYITNYYDQETKQLLDQQRQRNTVVAVLDQVPDFTLDNEKIDIERDRIFGVIKSNADENKQSLVDIFRTSGIPGAEDIKVGDDMQVKKTIEKYVRNEFKLSAIWDFIYETKIESKVTQDQIEKGASEVMQSPEKYNLNKDITLDNAQNYAYSNLKKNKAAQWLYGELAKQESDKK